MTEHTENRTDPNLAFLNKFINLYQEMITHDGYADITVNICLMKRNIKEVRLQCGREYRFYIPCPEKAWAQDRYRIIDTATGSAWEEISGQPERRGGKDRRDYTNPRRKGYVPRNFKLERRTLVDRRTGKGRRRDDKGTG
nr:hypothetical protein [uncultured Desulfobacter sp.]